MNVRVVTALLTGGFGLGGVVGGVLLTNVLSGRKDQQRRSAEDDRRWPADRRKAYAAYLALVVATLADLERTSAALPVNEDEPGRKGNQKFPAEDVTDFCTRWERELQAALSEVQLIAGKNVAELADRTSWALMGLRGFIDAGKTGDVVREYSSKTRYLVDAVRNAMRQELGVNEAVRTFPMAKDWPWLEDDSKEISDDEEAAQPELDVAASEQPPAGTPLRYPLPDRADTVRGWMVV